MTNGPTSFLRAILVVLTPTFLILIGLGFSIGLTFAPCYSSLCVETYFPRQTRYHIALFYGLLAVTALLLCLRRYLDFFRRLSEYYLFIGPIPLIGGRVTLGGLLLSFWICGLTFGSIGYWYPIENEYWTARGALADWTEYMFRVIWTGVTGHWCDIWMGLVIIPIGRKSIVAEIFNVQPSTLLTAHKLIAYGLLVFSLIHGFLYYSFLGAYVAGSNTNHAVFQQFNPDNPLLTWHEAEEHGIYSWFVLPTGAIVGIAIIPIMAITALPILRRMHFNVFYFFHVVAAFLVMVFVCLHASTNFYFLVPGLLLWIGDWIWRLVNSLGAEIEATIESAGNDWYRVKVHNKVGRESIETALEKGGGSTLAQPLVHYFLNFVEVSKLQGHAFTASSIGDATSGPTFLFRKSPERKSAKKTNKEWTWKLAALADKKAQGGKVMLRSRIEGPYAPPIPEFFEADHLLLITGGTGITGAISISQWWTKTHGVASPGKSLHLIWTIRERDLACLSEVDELELLAKEMPNMTVTIHVSSESHRLSPEFEIERLVSSHKASGARFWVYVSGPAGLLESAETACIMARKSLKNAKGFGSVARLDWFVADYST